MIKIARTRTAAHLKGYTGSSLQTKLGKLVQYYKDDGSTGAIDFKLKGRQVWGKAKPALKLESSNKCAYCEADTAVVAHGDVEHFRPKSLYWWLAYCYDNYTYSCQICNQTYKGDQFPVTGPRLPAPTLPVQWPTAKAAVQSLLQTICPDPASTNDAAVQALFAGEDADLLNPYTVDPEAYFGWRVIPQTEEVWLVPRDTTVSARRAVKAAEALLGLNRQELLRLRWNAFDALETTVLALQHGTFDDADRRDLLQRIRRQANGDRPFAGMKRYFLREWGLL